jgi:hypothetical protein
MAADSNSWTLPGKGILGGVNLSIGTSKQDDSNSEYESAWARALREAIENLPGGDADRLAMAEQVRASHTGPIDPLAHPAAALINRLRQPSAPPQMPQTRPAGPEPYIAPRPDDVLGGIGKSIIEHHADYFDPWVRDEQGRRVIDTPAAYTPNEAMKLPETRKPWWMPLAGGAEIASNFIAPGVGAAGKVAMAAASIGGSGKGGRIGRLAMDEASRMTRARKLGYADEPFYRGERSGETPTEFSKGAHFSRDKDYAAGFAQQGGQRAPTEYRLRLDRAFRDNADLSAAQFGRLVEAANRHDPALASNLSELVAPGKGVDWLLGFAKARPDYTVAPAGTAALVRHPIEQSNRAHSIFSDAGFDALDSGRDVRKLIGDGIRQKDAAFDPRRAHEYSTLASLLGLLALPAMGRTDDPNSGQR